MSCCEPYRLIIIVFGLFTCAFAEQVELKESTPNLLKEVHRRHAVQPEWMQPGISISESNLLGLRPPAPIGSTSPPPSEEPNLVEAIDPDDPSIDVRKLQRLELAKRRSTETLVLDYIVEDYSFTSGEDVVEWAHVWHNGKEYFVGRRERDLQIVRLDKMVYDVLYTVDVGQPITYMTLYSFWNVEQQQQEGVLLVAAGENIFWYRYNPQTELIELNWEWKMGRRIGGLTYFRIDSHEYLAITTTELSPRTGYFTLYIYQFVLHTQEFWIAQRVQLRHPCSVASILDTGRDIVLAVPQPDKAAIYTYNPHASTDASQQINFKLLRTFNSENITSITLFKMGGRSYLALSGMQPQILLYRQGIFRPRTIFGDTFGLVELFFPVPVRTYRDDLILLVQRRVDFSTHFVTVVEALIWNGETFEASLPVPCHQGQHTVYGVSCMLDIERDEGLKGATVLKREDQLAILVPRRKATSGLFNLHTKILVRNSKYQDLQEIYSFLKEWVQEHDELIAQAQAFLAADPATGPNFDDLTLLETPELLTGAEVGQVYINDYRWTTEDLAVDMDNLLLQIDQLGHELLVRGRQKRATTADQSDHDGGELELKLDSLEVDEVQVDELLLDTLNGEKFYIRDGSLNFPGILNVQNLEVTQPSSEPIQELQQTFLNLDFDQINGVDWKEIQEGLVFRDQPLTLSDLTVQGEVIIEDDLLINKLNDLNFPDDFLWSSGPTINVVQAEKTFLGTLAANNVDTDGLINGVNPFDAITLSDAQNWTGVPTFSNLEVSNLLRLNVSAQERSEEEEEPDDIESSPTLAESKLILSDCTFEHLEIQGPLFLSGLYDNNELSELLANVIQYPASPEEQIQVESPKKFASIEFPIDFRLHANAVNDIPLDQFVTLHTKQELNISTLHGYVYFNNLTMGSEHGLYDGVNITELQQNAIKIDEPVMAPDTQLNMFQNPTVENEYVVKHSLNGIVIDTGYQTIHEDLIVKALTADELHTKLADIPGNIDGTARLNGHQLDELLTLNFVNDVTLSNITSLPSAETMRTVEPFELEGNIFLNELALPAGLTTDALQGIETQVLLDFLDGMEDIPEMILTGKIEVNAVVTGDVQVNKLNGDNFDEDIQLTVIWLNRTNYLSTDLKFADPPHLHSDVYCEGSLNGQNLPDLIDDMIFRVSNVTTPLVIQATKQFVGDVIVSGNTVVNAINGLPFERIAFRRHVQTFEGSIRVLGNVYVQALTISGYLNEENTLKNLTEMVKYDHHLKAFVLQDEIPFRHPVRVQDLTVQGDFNEFHNISKFFKSLVYKNRVCLLRSKKTFTGRVSIDGGLYVRSLNGYNLLNLLSNIVLINERSGPVAVRAPVTFKAPVRATSVSVHGDLISSNLNGCELQAWLEDTLRVDRDENITKVLRFGAGALDGNSFSVNFINELELSQVITLHTSQILNHSLSFSELYLDGTLNVRGLINGVDLQAEYGNTLLTHGDQHISTPLTMQGCRVLKTLKTNAFVNHDKDLRNVATLQESLELRSPLFLQNISARRVYTNDLVSGINLDDWHRNSLWLQKRPQQWITGNWSAHTLSVRGLSGNEQLGGVPKLHQRSVRSIHDKDLGEVCQRVARLVDRVANRVSFVKYLEDAFELKLPSNESMRQIFSLHSTKFDYLLINVDCYSHLYKWNSSWNIFEPFTKFESGFIDQLIMVANTVHNNSCPILKFITNGKETMNVSRCTRAGLNSWILDDSTVKHFNFLGYNYTRIYQRHPYAPSFFAKVKQNNVIHVYSSFGENVTEIRHSNLSNHEEISNERHGAGISERLNELPEEMMRYQGSSNGSDELKNVLFKKRTFEGRDEIHDEVATKSFSNRNIKLKTSRTCVEEITGLDKEIKLWNQGIEQFKEGRPKREKRQRIRRTIKQQADNKQTDKLRNDHFNKVSDGQEVSRYIVPQKESKTDKRELIGSNNPISLTESEHEPVRNQLKSKSSFFYLSNSPLLPTSVNPFLKSKPGSNSEAKSKNTFIATCRHSLDMADFEEVMQGILEDLTKSLSVEINVTQLSIPESDLYDVHLLEAFIDIIQELENQKMLSGNTTDTEISSETLELPGNPPQALAARAVLIIWPTVIEVKEVHNYLKPNETHNHLLCEAISLELGMTIKDVLRLAYKTVKIGSLDSKEGKNQTVDSPINKTESLTDSTETMLAVVERIHTLQKKLREFIEEMNADLKEELLRLEREDVNEEVIEKEEVSAKGFEGVSNAHLKENSKSLKDVRWVDHSDLLDEPKDESIVLEVGPAAKPHLLKAFSACREKSAAGQSVAIRLYTPGDTSRKLLQTVSAQKPRSLISLRIRDETLLIFVENCCRVRVLIYRGVQGFIELVNFNVPERILNMIGISVQVTEAEQLRYFIAINTGKRVSMKFYEVILAGDKSSLVNEVILCE